MNRVSLLVGAAFGFLVAAARLSDYQVIHDMLRLREFDVFFLMGGAVAVAAPTLLLLERAHWKTPFGGSLVVQRTAVSRRAVFGALVFGSGWAVAGTCPVPALAMTASGGALGLVVAAGLFGGIALRDAIDRKQMVSPPSC